MSPAKTNQPTQQPGPEQQRLNVFVGQWKTEGQQYKSEDGETASITASETYDGSG